MIRVTSESDACGLLRHDEITKVGAPIGIELP
jgi:hypothetical protein